MRGIQSRDAAALLFLAHEASSSRGWKRRGVRGWRFLSEVAVGANAYLPERLPWLTRRGLLDAIDVREPWKRTAVFLYRVSGEGVRVLPSLVDSGAPDPAIAAPAPADEMEGVHYGPAEAWTLLELLRLHLERRSGRLRMGGYGWMTGPELNVAAGAPLGWEAKTWLLRRELIERRQVPNAARPTNPARMYRISEQGLAARLEDAACSPSGVVERVAVRIPSVSGFLGSGS